MNIIECTNLHKIYGKGAVATHVLRGISLGVREGEFLGIMGKSGAGKSTLMYQLSALDVPTEGTVLVQGLNIFALPPKELSAFRLHTLGYVFQDYALIQDLTARENVMLPLLMRGTDWDTALRTAQGALTEVGLANKFVHMPSELSGGEQQRVAIARAVAGQPKILFADEPTANLDSISGGAIIDLFGALNKKGQTIVMVTHEKEYTRFCSRIIFLEDGRIVGEERRA